MRSTKKIILVQGKTFLVHGGVIVFITVVLSLLSQMFKIPTIITDEIRRAYGSKALELYETNL